MGTNINTSQKQKVKALILVGGRDFGRCPLASYTPTALWPVMGQPVLERLLTHLADQGIKDIVIGSNDEDSLLIESIRVDKRLEVKFLEEPLPVGTAGCIRDAVEDETDTLLLVVPASMVCPPDIDVLINMHSKSRSDLTVILNPGSSDDDEQAGQASGIYLCTTDLLKYIPEEGYCDIKESLIPKLINEGKTVHVDILPKHTCNFRDRQEYLHAIAGFLEENNFNEELKSYKEIDSRHVWISSESEIDPTARILGPVIIMDGAHISEGAVIIGPTVLGKNVIIDKNCVIINSVLWDGVQVGTNCQIKRCVIDYNRTLEKNSVAQDKCIPFNQKNIIRCLDKHAFKFTDKLYLYLQKISNTVKKQDRTNTGNIAKLFGLGLVLAAFIWSYWPGLEKLWKTWLGSDEYSSGLLVPFLTVYILWLRRETITKCPLKTSIVGLFIFLFAQVFRVFGLLFIFRSAERLSIILSIAGLVLFLFGWKFFRKVATVLLFLCLMLPWPNRIKAAISLPLQRWSTASAVFCLEVLGYEIMQEGNVIHIGQSTVAIAEACNGLRMITAFFVICGLVVMLVKRAWWEKLIILISSLPIALLCNTLRLAITAIFFTILEGEYWEKIFHDFGGYAMMPVAIGIIVAELWLLTELTVPPEEKEEIIIVRKK
jgi:exosortase